MPKPIFIIKVRRGIVDGQQGLADLTKTVAEKLKHEYHILAVEGDFNDTVSFDCFNDCKGFREDFKEIVEQLNNKSTG